METPTKSEVDIQQVLGERGEKYGNFLSDATICQSLKDIMHREPGWSRLLPDQKQALEMVMVKVARVLNGDPDYVDNWVDMSGYVTLVVNRLRSEKMLALPAPSSQVSSDELPTMLRNSEEKSIQ